MNKKFTDLCRIDCLDEVDDKMGLLPLITPFIVKKEIEIQEIIKNNEILQGRLDLINKNIVVLVEGKHDKDCFQIENVLKRGDVFSTDPDKIYIGMLDFDNAFECFERLEKHKEWSRDVSNREAGLSLIHKSKRGGLFLLPVPNHRLMYAGEEYKKASCLTIELLFEDSVLNGFVKRVKKVGGSNVFYMPDEKKKKFAKHTASFNKDDFKHFKTIIEKINNIIETIEDRN